MFPIYSNKLNNKYTLMLYWYIVCEGISILSIVLSMLKQQCHRTVQGQY